MDKTEKILFQLHRSMQLLLDYFGLEDKASMVEGEFVCVSRSEYPYDYPYVHYRGTYLNCLYEAFKRPGSRIIPLAESELSEQLYRLGRTDRSGAAAAAEGPAQASAGETPEG